MSTLYISKLAAIAEKAAGENEAAFEAAAKAMSETLANKGLVHLYGSGHSVLPVQETYPRYGSYVGFNPLTDPRLMWHNILGAGGARVELHGGEALHVGDVRALGHPGAVAEDVELERNVRASLR